MKEKICLLKQEILSKWKDIIVLLLCFIEEMFIFSILTTELSMPVVVVINIIMVISIVTFFILAIKEKNPSKRDLKRFIIFVILALIFGVIRSYLYIASLLIAYLFLNRKEQLYKWTFLISCSCFFIYLFLVLLSIVPDSSFVRMDGETITNIRHSLGFNHPNQPLKFYLTIIISGYLWMCKSRKSTLIYSFIMLIPALLISYSTNSRTGMILSLFLLVIMNIPQIFKFIKIKWLYLLFTLATAFLIISYNLDLGYINRSLSGRPAWFNTYLNEFPEYILFGKAYAPLLFNMFEYPLDNGFLYMVFDGGIFALVIVNVLFYKSFKNCEDAKIKIALIVILGYSLTEALCTPFTNLIYIFMFYELLTNYYKLKNDNVKKIEVKDHE